MAPPNDAITFCRTLVDEWVRLGVSDAVICPGSRSTPMALALAGHPGVRVHVHVDERSAAFVALGLGLATRRPAVVLTTSGTAAVELHPAVVEAHQAAVPMIAVTADRPPELRDRWAPQTIDQRDLYGPAVRWYCEPGPPDAAHAATWRVLAADVLAHTNALRPGPVHLNLAFREPLTGASDELPDPDHDRPEPVVPTWSLLDEQLARLVPVMAAERGVIVAGARAAWTPDERDAVLDLARTCGWPVLADATSGCRVPDPHVVSTFDPLLRTEARRDELRPDVVVHLGGLLASRVTNEALASSGARHLGFDRFGVVPDPDGTLAASFAVAPAVAARQLAPLVAQRRAGAPPSGGYLQRWTEAERAARLALDEVARQDESTITEPAVATHLIAALPDDAELVVSSSMPVRDLEWYAPPRDGCTVRSNRGANGIDGVVSTAIGVALGGARTACLVGDVAFVHDTNAMAGLRERGVDLLVVVVDNDGGGIFSFLPQATEIDPTDFELLFGTPHGTNLPMLAVAHGLEVGVVDDLFDLDEVLLSWLRTGGVRIVIAPSDRDANREVHRRLNEAVALRPG
jgi:2-succinyl-5-enolpyruvyl-6-hydroxy-3-cyclohexene-1-carboxylate synthase